MRRYLNKKSTRFKIDCQEKINKVIDYLKTAEYINDENYIKLWVEDRSYFKPRGKKLLIQELKQKGIDGLLIDNYFNDYQLDELVLIKKILQKKQLNLTQDNKEKLLKLLLRRGFDYQQSKNAIEQSEKEE